MRLSLAVAALCAVPALATPVLTVKARNKGVDVRDGRDHSESYSQHSNWKSERYGTDKHDENDKRKHVHEAHHKHDHKHHHPHYHAHHHHHKYPQAKKLDDAVLTDAVVCKKLNRYAEKADYITGLVKNLYCESSDEHCGKEIRKELYHFEFDLDIFDHYIDSTSLEESLTCPQEYKVADCYQTVSYQRLESTDMPEMLTLILQYSTAVVHMLNVIKEKSKYLEGEVDRLILIAVNSFRSADAVSQTLSPPCRVLGHCLVSNMNPRLSSTSSLVASTARATLRPS